MRRRKQEARWTGASASGGRIGAPGTRSKQAAEEASRAAGQIDLSVRFRIEREEGIIRILVVERRSDKVVRMIPPEHFLMKVSTAPPTASSMKGPAFDETV